MNRDLLETQWPQIREILHEKFSNLTDEDIRQINGRYDQLVAKLQQKYGYTREEAEDRIRNWNFDRFATTPKGQVIRDERMKKDEYSNFLPWLLALGIPLVLLGTYFLSTAKSPDVIRSPNVAQEQIIAETPADHFISNGIRTALLSQQSIAASQIQNLQITTHDGVVTLSGTVANRDISDLIAATAQNFAGVRQVINNLQIR